MVRIEGWENEVTIVSCDMRFWDAPEKADILVNECGLGKLSFFICISLGTVCVFILLYFLLG